MKTPAAIAFLFAVLALVVWGIVRASRGSSRPNL